MCWNCLHIHSPSNSDTHYLRIIFGHWEYTKTLDETCNIIFAYRIFRCNVANSSTIIYCVQCTHGVCLLLGFLTHKSKMCCCRNKSAAKTTNINTARINFYPEEVKKERNETWKNALIDVVSKDSIHLCHKFYLSLSGSLISFVHSHFVLVFFFFWKTGGGSFLVLAVVGGPWSTYTTLYTYNRFIYELMADMLVK